MSADDNDDEHVDRGRAQGQGQVAQEQQGERARLGAGAARERTLVAVVMRGQLTACSVLKAWLFMTCIGANTFTLTAEHRNQPICKGVFTCIFLVTALKISVLLMRMHVA